jgi:AraC family transcriptional regulator
MQIQKAIDYIENNLDFDIPLAQVACAAGISQWHFQRIFRALTNETLKAYIRSRRLANSLDKLSSTDNRIIDIAISAGFESQESFTRAFKKNFTMTPNDYRKLGNKHLFLKKVQLDQEYLLHINSNISLTPEIALREKTQLVGMKTCFYGVDSEKNNLAEKLPSLWDNFLERSSEIADIIPDIGYGVIQQSSHKNEQLDYYAALEVNQVMTIPDNMTSIEIPSATYATFSHRGKVENINNTVNYIYSNWLLQSGMRHTYGPDLEIYGPDYHPTSEQSLIHYAIPVIRNT